MSPSGGSGERRKEPRSNEAARTECYQRIRDCMKEGIAKYYNDHPDRLLDDRSQEAIRISLQGLERIFSILSEYKILLRDHADDAHDARSLNP